MSLTINSRLCIAPIGRPPVIRVGQYDSNFEIEFEMYTIEPITWDLEEGTTAMIRGTKTDKRGYSADCDIDIENKKVTVYGDVQMTAAAGPCVYEIVLKKNDKEISSINFTLQVERAALDADTIPSESKIKEIQDIGQKADEIIEAYENLQFDTTPTAGSTKAVTSGGIKTYVDEATTTDTTLSETGKPADAEAVGDEVTDLKSAFNGFTEDGVIYAPYERILNRGFDTSTGETPYESGWDITSFIPVTAGETIHIYNGKSTIYNGFYRSDKTTFVGSFTVPASGDFKYVVPENASYMVLTNSHGSFNFKVWREADSLTTLASYTVVTLKDIPHGYGNWAANGSTSSSGEYTIRSLTQIPVKAGDVIKLTNPFYQYGVAFFDGETSTGTDWTNYGTDYVVQTNGYIKLNMRKKAQTHIDSDEIDTIASALQIQISYFNRTGFDDVLDNKNAIALSNRGYETLNPNDFVIGALMSNNGGIDTSNHKRVTSNILSTSVPLYLVSDDGYQFAIGYYDSQNTFKAYKDWQTEFYIPAGYNYRISIRKTTAESNLPYLDSFVYYLVSKVHVKSQVGRLLPDYLIGELTQDEIGLEFGYTYYYSETLFPSPADYAASTKKLIYIPKDTRIYCDYGYTFKQYVYNTSNELVEYTNAWHTGDSHYVYTAANDCKVLICIQPLNETVESVSTLCSHLHVIVPTSYTILKRLIKIEDKLGYSDTYNYNVIGLPINLNTQKYNNVKINGIASTAPNSITLASVSSNQGMAIYNGVICQLYSDNVVELLNLDGSGIIADLSITSGHGDCICFSNEFYAEGDEFPLAYITAETDVPKVYVNRITRSGCTLIRTLKFDGSITGYYPGHCLDVNANKIYLVGYANNDALTDANNNHMIVTVWNLSNLTENSDNTYSPEFVETFTIPFIHTVQGQKFFDGKLVLLASNYPDPHNTCIYFVDPGSQSITTILDSFHTHIKNAECEDFDFVLDGEKYYIVIKPNTTAYYRIDFS